MTTLFNDDDRRLLDQVNKAFLDGFDAAHASRRIRPYLMKQVTPGRLAVAEWLRQGWQSKFGDARVLNDNRLQAVCRALDEEITPAEIAWAIVAYHHECTTDKARLANPAMRRTFESFLVSGVLEIYIPLGQQRKAAVADAKKRAAHRAVRNREESTVRGLIQQFERLSNAEQSRLIDQAAADLTAQDRMVGRAVMANPLIRSKVFQLLQAEAKDRRRDVPGLGPSVADALQGGA